LYPEYPWELWYFDKIPKRAFYDHEQQKKYLDWFADQRDIKEPQDWYKVHPTDIYNTGGKTLLQRYDNSVYQMLSAIYPEYELHQWNFESEIQRGCWDDIKCQRMFVDWLSKKLNIENEMQWYDVKGEDVLRLGGEPILRRYESISKCLPILYPEKSWQVWLENKVPNGFWEERKNRRNYLDWFAKIFNIKDFKDWYK
jgi:hypothetical protein